MRDLKKYDKLLSLKRNIDGSLILRRKSPFSSTKIHEIIKIKNQYLGSYSWLLKRIMKMDNQRVNIFGKAHANNKAIRNKKDDDRITRDIADFFEIGGDSNVV